MAEGGFKFKDATLRRCKVIRMDEKQKTRFMAISLEFFHFFYEVKKLDFSIYFRVQDTILEYIKPEEFNKQLLDEIAEAMKRPLAGTEVCILRSDRARYDAIVASVRDAKVALLKQKVQHLDGKTLALYSKLSTASQMIVSGGIDPNVVSSIKASAAFLVANTIDSDAAISTLSRMVTCDPTLYDHSASVAMIASVIALRLLPKPLTNREAEVISQCALYHDLGKTCVPNSVLNKPGKFTPEEYEIVKKHTTLGYEELEKLIEGGAAIEKIASRVALEHHEKWDGSGYPHGRKGALEQDPKNGIHLYSRIVTISDIYSALLMKRVYKPAFEPQDALKIMAAEAKGFDPAIFVPFLKGVVSSLNAEQAKAAGKGRILVLGEGGTLGEWNDNKKVS